jgi:NAD(P)-dependent dehydrogenase (short-subunit alcohol dehydrogenase family)
MSTNNGQLGRLTGKVAVITGGNSGIGFAVAQEFKNNGAKVIITGRNGQAVQEAAANLGADVLGVEADVRDAAALEALFQRVKAQFGGVDVLFVNAGIAKMGAIQNVSESLFDEVMDVNFKGAYFTIQKALPVLNDNASVILNGSVNSYVGFPNASVYSASKAALHSLARTLSAELVGRGIRVNTLNIGPIDTPLYGKLGFPEEVVQGFAQAVLGKVALKRFGSPEEVFLASDESSFVVGSEITTDGGIMMNAL